MYDICDGIRDNLEHRAPVRQAKYDALVQIVLTLPEDPEFSGINWIHSEVEKCSGYISFKKYRILVVIKDFLYYIIMVRNFSVNFRPSNWLLDTWSFTEQP